MKAGGIFGGNALSGAGLGIDPPFPDTYGCNTDDQCQSNWCNTAVRAGNAAGQCQTKGLIQPGVGGQGGPGNYCRSDDNCKVGLTCNTKSEMCESPSDPGNKVYTAQQLGQQHGMRGIEPWSRDKLIYAVAAKEGVSKVSQSLGNQIWAAYESAYKAGYTQAASEAMRKGLPVPATQWSSSLTRDAAKQIAGIIQELKKAWKVLAQQLSVTGVTKPLAPEPVVTYRRLRDDEVTAAVRDMAKKIIQEHHGDPVGTNVPFEIGGKQYVGRIENHYHPPGGALKPWGWHKGCSMFAVESAVSGLGEMTPLPSLPILGVGALLAVGGLYYASTRGVRKNRARTKTRRGRL
jgi:hypothetical protein